MTRGGLPPGDRRYAVLLVSTLLLLGVQGIAAPTGLQQVIVAVLAGSSVLLSFSVARLEPALMRVALAVAVLVVVLSVVRATVGGVSDGAARLCNAALVALGPPAIAIGVVRDLRISGRVGTQAVSGVLALYVLIGMVFAFLYAAIDAIGDAPFFAGGQPATVSHCLYYSFVTLATVGYGDFVAASDLGHTLAIFESLIGQIYLVTVVSLIVSNLGRTAGTRSRV